MVIAAAEAGASVYLEKPMARTPAEADRMIDACDRAHVKLAVAHQMRISPAIEQAKRLLGEGALGRLQELRGRGKEDRRAGGEDLMVLGAHVMDLMRQFAGDPLWAFGRVTTAGRGLTRAGIREGPEGLGLIAGDAIAGLFGFRDGLTGYFASKQCGQSDGGRFGVDLYGSEGILSIRAATEPQIHLCSSSRWTNAPWRPVASPAPAIRSSPEPAPPAAAPGGASPPAHLAGPPPRDANVPLVADLLEAIEQDRPPRASGVEARWTIEMAMALYESERTGARVRLPLADRGHPLEKLG